MHNLTLAERIVLSLALACVLLFFGLAVIDGLELQLQIDAAQAGAARVARETSK